MNEPKRQHTTSEFYLRRFAVNERVVVVDRLDLSKSRLANLDDALVARHFYSLPDEDKGWDTTVEKEIASKIEGPAARAIERVVQGRVATTLPAIRRQLSYFIALQYVRGPMSRQIASDFNLASYAKVAQTATPEIIQAELRRQGKPTTFHEARRLVKFARNPQRRVEHQAIAGKKRGAASVLHVHNVLPLADTIAPLLMRRSWTILEFSEACLVTGDEPVVPVAVGKEPGEPIGIKTADRIIFPLDPRHLLMMSNGGADGRSECDLDQAPDINRHIAFRCYRHIVHQPGTTPLTHIGTLPEKAPLVQTTGSFVLMQPAFSRDAAARNAKRTVERDRS